MRKLFNSAFKITQRYGERPDYYKQFGLKGHEGIDLIPSDSDWSVFCLEDGTVVKDEDNSKSGAYGINVTVWHQKINKATQYCHLSVNNVSMGRAIKAGDLIGKMGATGNTQGSHLHLNLFETDAEGIRKNRDNGYFGGIDPLPFLTKDHEEIAQPIAQITDQTKIPQIGDKEVQQIRSEIHAKDSKILDDANVISRLTEDLAKAVKALKELEQLYKEAITQKVDPNVVVTTTTYPASPKTSPETPDPVFSGILVNLLHSLRKKLGF